MKSLFLDFFFGPEAAFCSVAAGCTRRKKVKAVYFIKYIWDITWSYFLEYLRDVGLCLGSLRHSLTMHWSPEAHPQNINVFFIAITNAFIWYEKQNNSYFSRNVWRDVGWESSLYWRWLPSVTTMTETRATLLSTKEGTKLVVTEAFLLSMRMITFEQAHYVL